MHFIGNNSLVLHHPLEQEKGYPSLTLAYAPGWTVLSLVVSCTCMIGAFFVMGLEVGWDRWHGKVSRVGNIFRRGTATGGIRVNGGEDAQHPPHHHRHRNDHGDVVYEDEPVEITDLSDHALKDRPGDVLALDKDAAVKKKKNLSTDLRKHEIKLKLDAVIDKLEWALGWSMIDLGNRPGGRAERRKKQWEETRAEDKNDRLDSEGRAQEDEDGWDGKVSQKEEPAPVHIRPPPSDPVASGYDNEVLENDIVPANRYDRSPFDTGRSSREPPRKLSGREAEEGIVPVPAPTTGRYARRGSVPNIKLRDLAPFAPPLSADSAQPLFSPTFSFPGPGSTLHSERTTPLSGTTSAGSLYPPPSILQGRRASVPVNALFPRELPSSTFTLARIQSRPEVDGEDPLAGSPHDESAGENQPIEMSARREPLGQASSILEKRRESTASVTFRMDALGDTSTTNLYRPTPVERQDTARSLTLSNGDGESRRGRSRRSSKTCSESDKGWLAKAKSLLGYDVVTKQEVRKILIAGTICGWGIAGMRRSCTTRLRAHQAKSLTLFLDLDRLSGSEIYRFDTLHQLLGRQRRRQRGHRMRRRHRRPLHHVYRITAQAQARMVDQGSHRMHPRCSGLLHALHCDGR